MEPRKKYFPEFKEIVDRVPDTYSSILVCGLLLFLSILALLSIVIKVPERVTAEVRVTSSRPPITLLAQNQGKIKMLKKHLPCKCKSGEYIAVLENPSNTRHMQLLKKHLSNIDIFADSLSLTSLDDSTLYLGAVEAAYFNFRQQRQNYVDLINNSKYTYEIKLYDQKIANDSIHLLHLKKVLNNNKTQYKVRQKQYKTDSILFDKKAILESKCNQSYLSYLNTERQLMSLRADIYSKAQSIIDTRLRKTSLIREYNHSVSIAMLSLQEAYHNVITQIKAWEKAYVFMSVQDGTVDFVNLISDASFISSGEPVFDIVFDNNQFLGIALLPSLGAGGVMRGQRVNLKMDLFPYQEYGVLEGKVNNISLNSVDKAYLIYIKLPNGLTSSSKHEFTFAETMYGQAEIITDNKRLISRIFNEIYKLLNPSKSISEQQAKQQTKDEELTRTIKL